MFIVGILVLQFAYIYDYIITYNIYKNIDFDLKFVPRKQNVSSIRRGGYMM